MEKVAEGWKQGEVRYFAVVGLENFKLKPLKLRHLGADVQEIKKFRVLFEIILSEDFSGPAISKVSFPAPQKS